MPCTLVALARNNIFSCSVAVAVILILTVQVQFVIFAQGAVLEQGRCPGWLVQKYKYYYHQELKSPSNLPELKSLTEY